jgi:hypothetical protein
MKLEGILLFIAMAVVVETLVRIITTLPVFKKESDLISYLKFLISLGFAEAVSVSFVYLTKGGMILTYLGIVTFPYLDAVLSGLMISGGSNLVHDLFQTITSFKEKIQAQAEAAKTTAGMLKK